MLMLSSGLTGHSHYSQMDTRLIYESKTGKPHLQVDVNIRLQNIVVHAGSRISRSQSCILWLQLITGISHKYKTDKTLEMQLPG